MKGDGHKLTTIKAFEILEINAHFHPIFDDKDAIVKATPAVDQQKDLEFVDVDFDLDDPHKDSLLDDNDDPHYEEDEHNFTAFNHFIDIKKGAGIFDDYDGYSYEKGSASKDEYQSVTDATDDFWIDLIGPLTGYKVDEGAMYWFNDEYVHAPGHSWYQGCSPAIENYSFPQDKDTYASKEVELQARFPLADSTGESDKGIPYSVFMPVDNMAKYWESEFVKNPSSVSDPNNIHPLGYVMHAIQDASVPHHAAGYLGNWHQEYENELDIKIKNWSADPQFESEVQELYGKWSKTDLSPPSHLDVSDWQLTPHINWEVDQLVTWVALNAYKEYDQTYDHFSNGYFFDETSAKELTTIATAMSLLVLDRAGRLDDDYEDLGEGLNSEDTILNGYIGNDYLIGGEGNDSLFGGEGNDSLFGREGNDYLEGEVGNDYLVGEEGNDSLFGGEGNDELEGWYGDDTLVGGPGNDTLYGFHYHYIYENDENYDVLTGGQGADYFYLGGPYDSYFESSDYATITDFDWTEGDKLVVQFDSQNCFDYKITPFGDGVNIKYQYNGCLDEFISDQQIYEEEYLPYADYADGVVIAYIENTKDVLYPDDFISIQDFFGNSIDDESETEELVDEDLEFPTSISPVRGSIGEVPEANDVNIIDEEDDVVIGDGTASISGIKFNDLDGNGDRNTDEDGILEPGLAEVSIYLDENNNGVLDDDELVQITATDDPNTPNIDETGQYKFTNLPAGNYTVREVVPEGFAQTFPVTETNTGDGFADVVLDYFDSGEGPIEGPYGFDENDNYPVPVDTDIILGSDELGSLSLPTDSFVTVGFTDEVIIDGEGDDIFVPEVDAAEGEQAEVFVSSDLENFTLLGVGNGGTTSGFDLASINFNEPVRAVKIVGLDNGGLSPGFDVVNVQGLPSSLVTPDFHTVELEADKTADNINFGNSNINFGFGNLTDDESETEEFVNEDLEFPTSISQALELTGTIGDVNIIDEEPLLNGSEIQLQAFSPNLETPISQAVTATIEDGVEFDALPSIELPGETLIDVNIDITQEGEGIGSIFFEFEPDETLTSFASGEFNGYVFTDISEQIPAIENVTIDESTNTLGLEASDVAFTENTIEVNVEGLAFNPFNPEDRLLLNFELADV